MSLREKADFAKKLQEVSHKPGIYLMRDRLNHIIYVGKAKNLRKRLSSYFMPSRADRADLKTRSLIASIWDFETHTVRTESEALLLEAKLIKEHRPKYNISFRDDKRFLLLRVHMEEPLPRFSFSRVKKEDGARYFGPFAHSGSLRTTLETITRLYGLRVCRPLEPGEYEYKHCHNDVIKNCCAPCIGRVTREEYLARVEKACSILDGHSKELAAYLQHEMQRAAEAMEFEKAASLRDAMTDLKRTLAPTRRFTRGVGVPRRTGPGRVGENIRPMEDVRELQEELGLDTLPLVMECFDISNISSTHIVASMVRFKNGVPDSRNYRRYRIRTVQEQNDFASMAEVVRRRYSRILLDGRQRMGELDADYSQENPLDALRRLEDQEEEREELAGPAKHPFVRLPDLVIVDGGPGQLSKAAQELRRLGLQDLPVVGLAKEFEEIHFPDRDQPVRIPHERGALKLMQRIRDEAHRWANGYHQLLMKKRVEESILDDCPGVSPARKMALLKAFGSVRRLRKATAEALNAVPGISTRLAGEIQRFLETH
jgi:excinuclease ABC subunit C